jgi:hypothetical protein
MGNHLKITASPDSVAAWCNCGSRMTIPLQSIKMNPQLWCPCGALLVLDRKTLNRIQSLIFQNYITENA